MADWPPNPSGSDSNNDMNWGSNNFANNANNERNGTESAMANNTPNDFPQSGVTDDAGPTNITCKRCFTPGHTARECPEPRTDIACHNCGGPHMKKDCDQPQVKHCRLCKGEHDTIDCKTPYPIDLSDVPDIIEDECWKMLKQASNDVDIDDFKDGMKALQKACPEITYPALEKRLRQQDNKFYLIALEKDVGEGYTNVNMQGQAGQKFVVQVFKSKNCPRPNLVPKWPKDVEENLSRLADAGITLTRGLDHCRRCDKYGHTVKDCDEERMEVEGPKVICALCSEEGHRVRDCTQPRRQERGPITCKRCGNEGHMVKDCEEPEPAKTCRNCGEEGHISKDCEKTFCRNCDQEGHISKDCTQPRDWSKVVCRHCGEKGHASATRCKPGAQLEDKGIENVNPSTDAAFEPTSKNAGSFNDTPADGAWGTAPGVAAPTGDW